MSSEWVPLSDLDDWTRAIGRVARAGDVRGTVLYFEDPARVALATGRGVVVVSVEGCEVLTAPNQKGERGLPMT